MKQRSKLLAAVVLGFVIGILANDFLFAQPPVQIQVYGPGGFQPISAAPQLAANSFPVALPSDQTPNAVPGSTVPAMATEVAGVDPSGLARTIAVTQGGAVMVLPAPSLPLPPCNPVRYYNCQPKGF